MAAPTFALSANAFSRCAPALNTNIRQCGTVTVCQVAPMVSGDLTTTYMADSQNFRVMEALFHHDFELKLCEAQQNGLYEFFMANKVSMRRTMQSKRRTDGTIEIAPFVLGRRYSPINDAYWIGSSGVQEDDGSLTLTVVSSTNVPLTAELFPTGLRVYIQGVSAGGSSTKTAWTVVTSTLAEDGLTVALNLSDANAGSHLDADKQGVPGLDGTSCLIVRGTPNVNDFEKWCDEAPTYLNWNDFPFFVETIRNSTCKSSQYDKWRELVMLDNQLYKEYFYLPEIQRNQQIMLDWQKRIVNTFFWGTASTAYQTAALYDQLPLIEAFDPTLEGITGLGVDGGTCVGRRADAEGVYQQLAECSRIQDCQGAVLSLVSLFNELYNMMRVRESSGHRTPKIFDILTDSVTAENFSQAMLKYYNARSDGMARLNVSGEDYRVAKKANFGFSYRSFPLFWPAGVTVNIISHDYFDDWLTAATAAGMADTARVLWILDLPGIYPGILASNHTVHNTGDLQTLAKINESFACVMRVNTKQQELWSQTWTVVVECPKGNLIVENFAEGLPDHENSGGTYPSPVTTTTTTTAPT